MPLPDPLFLLLPTGSEVTIGPEVVVFVHRHCPPCMYNEKRNCRPGMMEAVWLEAGVNCEVVRGGTLREGDQVKLKPDSFRPDKIDCGLQSSGFFTRPSKRTAQQVRTRAPRLKPGGDARPYSANPLEAARTPPTLARR